MATQASSSSWAGHARIRGYTKLQRMAMLTFSLVGLQYIPPPDDCVSLDRDIADTNAGLRGRWK